ncbi:MAG: hypothetical protein JW803_07205 [Endomicrobiales bacterium]|nr:hypothetical protein [Endomicrobiales bacterium]
MNNKKLYAVMAVVFAFMVFARTMASAESVAVILSSGGESFKEALEGFKTVLKAKNPGIAINEMSLQGADSAGVVEKAVASNPKVIFTIGSEAAKAATSQSGGIPVVFCMVFNAAGMAGPTATGVSLDIPANMRLSGIKKILPSAKKAGIIYSANTEDFFSEFNASAKSMGIQVSGKKIGSDAEFPGALKEVTSGIDFFMMVVDLKIYFSQTIKFLLLESLKNKFPVIGLSSFYTKAGALASFDCDYADIGKQSGELVSRIIGGENPGSIKPARPKKIKTSVNVLVAEKMGITIPSEALNDASEVIK